jgi:hypothetical protein
MGGSGRKEKGQGAPGKIALLLPLIQNRGGGGRFDRATGPADVSDCRRCGVGGGRG